MVQGGRRSRPLGGAKYYPGHQQNCRASAKQHRKLQHRPQHAHGQQDPSGRHLGREETYTHRTDCKQKEESAADKTKLTRRQTELTHRRLGNQSQNSLIGKVDHLKDHQHAGDQPGAAIHLPRGDRSTQCMRRICGLSQLCHVHTSTASDACNTVFEAAAVTVPPTRKLSLSSAA
ncbi:hypothetical protein D3C76_588300 [compost metagenome]